MIRIRPLTPADLPPAREIWESCFEEDQPPFLDWYFQDRFHPGEGLGVFIATQGKETLVANLHLAPYSFRYRDRFLPTAYLIALATKIEYRRQGFATQLLKYALNHLAKEGKFFTFLLPFNREFYYRLGWGPLSALRAYRPPPARAYSPRSTEGLARIDSPELTSIQRIFSAWSSRFDLCLQRRDADWQGLIFDHSLDGGEIWLAENTAGQPEGYALTLQKADGECLVRELAYTTPQAGQRLLARLLRKRKTSLVWNTPPDEPLAPRACHSELSLLYLGRITDLQGLLESLSYPEQADLTFMVHDPLVESNNGVFHLQVGEDGRARVSTVSDRRPEFSCGIELLTPLIFGFSDLSSAGVTAPQSGGLLWEEPPPALGALFPKAASYINDYF